MNPIKYFKAPYSVEAVASQRQNLLKVRLAGVWGSAACAASGFCLTVVGGAEFVESKLASENPAQSLAEITVGSLVVGVFGGLSHHGFSSWNRDTIQEQQLIQRE